MSDFGDDVGDMLFRQLQRSVDDLIRDARNNSLRQHIDAETGKTVNEFDFHSETQRNAVVEQLAGEGVPIQAVDATKVIFYQEDAPKVIAALENYRKQVEQELEHPSPDVNDRDYESIAATQAAREQQQATIEEMYRERGFDDAADRSAAVVGADKLSDALRDNPAITKVALNDLQAQQARKIEPAKTDIREFGMKAPRLKDQAEAMRVASAQLAGGKTTKTREMQIDKNTPSR